MKRLFKIEAHGVTAYFDNKMKAKELRDKTNNGNSPGYRVVVSLGPDHRNYKGK